MKRSRGGVLGVPQYLLGIRDFSAFRCHPLLMPIIRPDGRMYYPCLEWKQAADQPVGGGELLGGIADRPGPIRPDCRDCRDCCHIFCHMALSLLQTHPAVRASGS